jgi:hypothetical protein
MSTLQVECNQLEDQNPMSMSMICCLENEIMQLQRQPMSVDASNELPGLIEIDEKENDPVSDLICMDNNNIDDI